MSPRYESICGRVNFCSFLPYELSILISNTVVSNKLIKRTHTTQWPISLISLEVSTVSHLSSLVSFMMSLIIVMSLARLGFNADDPDRVDADTNWSLSFSGKPKKTCVSILSFLLSHCRGNHSLRTPLFCWLIKRFKILTLLTFAMPIVHQLREKGRGVDQERRQSHR